MSDEMNNVGATPATEPSTGSQDAPLLIFSDDAGNQINEISLAPGEQKKIKVVLSNHPEGITQNFLAQWSVYDPNHQLTSGISCVMDSDGKKWLNPLYLSTTDESVGGMSGNDLNSARMGNGVWRCMGKNPNGQFWYPRDMYIPPVPVAEFVLMASSDWTDKYATFELDNNVTKFVMTTETGTPAANGTTVTCNYSMKLTVNNANASNVTPPQENDGGQVTPPPQENGGGEIAQEPTSIIPTQPAGSTTPLLVFGDGSSNPINEISLAPGEEKKVKMILYKHPEEYTANFVLCFGFYDSDHQRTTEYLSCKFLDEKQKQWITPLNLPIKDESGAIEDGILVIEQFLDDEGMRNAKKQGPIHDYNNWFIEAMCIDKPIWQPSSKFMPPIAVAEFTIQAPNYWSDQFATFEMTYGYFSQEKLRIYLEGENKPEVHYTNADYSLVLTIKNSNSSAAVPYDKVKEEQEKKEQEKKEQEEKERKEREERERKEREEREKKEKEEARRKAIRDGLRSTSVDPKMVLYNDTLYKDNDPGINFVVSAGECYQLKNEVKTINKRTIYVKGGGFHNIYPGAIVIADKRLSEGSPIPLANVARSQTQIFGTFYSGKNTLKTVDASSAGNVHNIISDMLRELFGSQYQPAGTVDFNSKIYTSKSDMMVNLGVDASFCGSNVKVNATINNNESTFIQDTGLEQSFFTVRLNDNYRDDVSKLFGDKETWDNIKEQCTINGKVQPLAIITSVTYGRSVHFLKEFSTKSFHYEGDQSHTGHGVDLNSKQDIAKKCEATNVQLISLGDAGAAGMILTDSSTDDKALKAMSDDRIRQALEQTSKFGTANQGVPLSYTIELISGEAPGTPIAPVFDGQIIESTYKRCPGSVQVYITNKAYCTASEENVRVSIGFMTCYIKEDAVTKKYVKVRGGHKTWQKTFKQSNNAQVSSLPLTEGEYLDMEYNPTLTIESRGTSYGVLGKKWKINVDNVPFDASSGVINLIIEGNTLKKDVHISKDSKTTPLGWSDPTSGS